MKFRVQAADLQGALDLVSVVPPKAITPQGGAGFLFVVRGDRCFLYSQDSLHVTRADLPITDVEGEGRFIYPASYAAAFQHVDGWIEIESGKDEKEDRDWVRYKSESGANGDRSSFDPRLLGVCDDELEATKVSCDFPVAIFRDAIGISKPYLAKPGDTRSDEHYKGLQIFDDSKDEWKKGNGTMFASDGTRACYYYCDNFEGKGMAIHGQHLGFLAAFLSKCEGKVTLRVGENKTFAVDSKGRVFGWAHHLKHHPKYGYYSLKGDNYVLHIPKDLLIKALRYARTELAPKRDKIRVTFDYKEKTLLFRSSEASGKAMSFPVLARVTTADDANFEANVNVDHMIDLVEGVRTVDVELRTTVVPSKDGRKGRVLFRTLDDFYLNEEGKSVITSDEKKPEDVVKCKVTRFMPSKD